MSLLFNEVVEEKCRAAPCSERPRTLRPSNSKEFRRSAAHMEGKSSFAPCSFHLDTLGMTHLNGCRRKHPTQSGSAGLQGDKEALPPFLKIQLGCYLYKKPVQAFHAEGPWISPGHLELVLKRNLPERMLMNQWPHSAWKAALYLQQTECGGSGRGRVINILLKIWGGGLVKYCARSC